MLTTSKLALLAPIAAIALLSGDVLAPGNMIVRDVLGTGLALADDDDDDDGGNDGNRGSRGSGRSGSYGAGAGWSGGKSLFPFREFLPRRTAPRRSRAAAPAAPIRAPDEIVGLGFSSTELGGLAAAGFELLERNTMASFNAEVIKLRIPQGLTLEAARQQARALAPQAVIDFNHYFRPEQHPDAPCVESDCLARDVIGWPSAQTWPGTCAAGVRIGLVDTAINPDHIAFEARNVEIVRLVDEELPESGRQHGTAVAALLVGSATSRTPGLIPGGKLIAVDAFHRAGRQDDRSAAFDLARALDLLVGRQVQVINLSLAGPPNLLLEQAVKKAGERGIIMVAAAGNDGPRAKPVYPAAYEEVIAVTATDRRKRPYRRAGRGEHIDFAAPGVAVWTAASVSGARPKTGTSFAAPFVTAAVAMMKASEADLAPELLRDRLTGHAEDLGEPGKDPVFGWGLLNARAICKTKS
ncbi:S8 family serine peptidase [Sinorhizobium meliloti]|uniref:S8 family serine peptidase n=1 Tax=Sinorhizobium TaxID=28105 RepID=UPI000C9B75B5|nr:S8 family serine peptidase [Sinorhizobium sp. M4_45]PND26178.1 peptidase S8 [Sinorhizobium sp. M4_45]GCA49728.1 minor extracellular protease Epr precursor [Sinorhizobium sp. KGO-5]